VEKNEGYLGSTKVKKRESYLYEKSRNTR